VGADKMKEGWAQLRYTFDSEIQLIRDSKLWMEDRFDEFIILLYLIKYPLSPFRVREKLFME